MARFKVALLDVLAPETIAIVREQLPGGFELQFAVSDDEQQRRQLVSDADFIMAGYAPVSAALISAAPKLKLIQKTGIGIDKIDVGAASMRGIPVAITAGANSIPVAEYAVLLMLAVYRRLTYSERNFRATGWGARMEMRAVCYQVYGKTVGLIGFGNIGRQVAKRVRAFDARVIYFDKMRPPREVEEQLGVEARSLEELFAESDIISLHCPLTVETRNLINAEAISMMKPTSIIINTSRGEVIDEDALIDALESGRIMGAGLDVFANEPAARDHPLTRFDNVVATPHCAGSVIDNVGNVFRHAFANIAGFAKGDPLPEADLVRVQ